VLSEVKEGKNKNSLVFVFWNLSYDEVNFLYLVFTRLLNGNKRVFNDNVFFTKK